MVECFKCGRKTGKTVSHHISYNPEVIVDCCWSCHQTLHPKVRKHGLCPLSIEETRKLSIISSNRRNISNGRILKKIAFHEKMYKGVRFTEHVLYNINTGNVYYDGYFEAINENKLVNIEV